MAEIADLAKTGIEVEEGLKAAEEAGGIAKNADALTKSVENMGKTINDIIENKGGVKFDFLESGVTVSEEGFKIGEKTLSKEEIADAAKSFSKGDIGEGLEQVLPKEQFEALTKTESVETFFKDQSELAKEEGGIVRQTAIADITRDASPKTPEQVKVQEALDDISNDPVLDTTPDSNVLENQQALKAKTDTFTPEQKTACQRLASSFEEGYKELKESIVSSLEKGLKEFVSGSWVGTAIKIAAIAGLAFVGYEVGYWLYHTIKKHQNEMNGCWLITNDGKKKVTNLSCDKNDVANAKQAVTLQCQSSGCGCQGSTSTGSCDSCCQQSSGTPCNPEGIKGKYQLTCMNANTFQAVADLAKEPLDAASDTVGSWLKNIGKIILFVIIGIILIFVAIAVVKMILERVGKGGGNTGNTGGSVTSKFGRTRSKIMGQRY